MEAKIDLLLYRRRGEYDARGSRSSFRGAVAPSGSSSSGGGGGSVVQAGGGQGVLARLTNLRRIRNGRTTFPREQEGKWGPCIRTTRVHPHLTYDVVFPRSNRAATLEELRFVYVRRTLGRILINYPHLADSAAIGDHEGVSQPPVGTGAANRVDSSARRSHEDAVQLGGAVEVVHPKVGAGVGGGRAAAAAPAAPALAAAATHPAATQ